MWYTINDLDICPWEHHVIYSNLNKKHNSSALSQKRKVILRAVQTLKTNSYFFNWMAYQWNILKNVLQRWWLWCRYFHVCATMLCGKKNRRFVGRVFLGMVFDGIEGLSIEFNEVDDNNFNIVMVVLTAFFYLNLFFYIFVKYRRGEDVYTIKFVVFFSSVYLLRQPSLFSIRLQVLIGTPSNNYTFILRIGK